MVGVVPYLRLVRLPNLFTAVSNVVGGHVISSGGTPDLGTLGIACIGSTALYAGGVALNDFADRGTDRIERPERPIPSGSISPGAAGATAALLLLFGGLSGFGISPAAGAISMALCGAVLGYNLLLKRRAWTAPLGMGLCRGMNWVFGLVSGGCLAVAFTPCPAILFVYAALLTAAARREAQSATLRRFVKAGILAIPLVDGILVASYGHPLKGIAVALLFFPAWATGRFFEST
jgi:4-hydroxybenzoate polyprenyltransferase